MLRFAAAFAVLATLAACQTPYQEAGLRGGVVARQVTADTWRISARGNGYTDKATIQDYVLLRAAETTLAAGGTHFIIVGSEDASSAGAITTPGYATTTFTGNSASTFWMPGSTSIFIRPGADVLVKSVPAGTPGAIDAKQVVEYVGSRVQRA